MWGGGLLRRRLLRKASFKPRLAYMPNAQNWNGEDGLLVLLDVTHMNHTDPLSQLINKARSDSLGRTQIHSASSRFPQAISVCLNHIDSVSSLFAIHSHSPNLIQMRSTSVRSTQSYVDSFRIRPSHRDSLRFTQSRSGSLRFVWSRQNSTDSLIRIQTHSNLSASCRLFQSHSKSHTLFQIHPNQLRLT